METYLLTHEHRFGATSYIFKSKSNHEGHYNNESSESDIKAVTEPLDIDFEWERGETINIEALDITDIKEIP